MKKKFAAVLATTLVAGVMAVPAQAAQNMDKHSDVEYATWSTTDDWRIVEAYSTLYGEPTASAYNQDSTVINTFAAGYNLNHADYRSSWGTYYYPSSKNHIILIENRSYPSYSGGIWTPTIKYSFDNTKTQNELSPYAKYAIDWLYDIAKTASQLPLPPLPWDLLKVPTGVTITPVQNSSVQVKFNADPTVMSVEYSINPAKPVKTGTYGINVRSKADAGYYIQPLMGVAGFESDVMDDQGGRVAPKPKDGVKVKEAKPGKEKKVKMKKGDFEYETVDYVNEPAAEAIAEPDALTWTKDGDISMINFGDFTVTVIN